MWGLFVASRKATRTGRVHLIAGLATVALCGGLSTQSAVAQNSNNDTWGGLGWGLGVAADFDLGGTRVNGAQIVTNAGNSIVRVTDSTTNVGVGFVLEAHYFFTNWDFSASNTKKNSACDVGSMSKDSTPNYVIRDSSNCTKVGIGPFIALEVGGASASTAINQSTPITAFAMGVLFGLHHPTIDPKTGLDTSTRSWNFGVGLRVDPKAQVLGDGFVANMAPPAGETSVRYKYEPRAGVILLSSISF
jgi:hypothetical protein